MRVCVTSDFHWNEPPETPECDLLLLAGDVLHQPVRFAAWLERQPARHIVGVAGNHDYLAVEAQATTRGLPWLYLENESVDVDGVTIFGSPLSTPFNNWAFMAPEDELAQAWEKIPDETSVLVVHGPARGILDATVGGVQTGSKTLRERALTLPNLRLLATGHIHEAYGQTTVLSEVAENGSLRGFVAVNASWVDEHYKPGNPPIVIDLPKEERE